MPRQGRGSGAASNRLTRLRRLPDLTIEGGVRPLSVYVREGDSLFQPLVALWIESTVGLVRAYRLVMPDAGPEGGRRAAAEALVEALASPAAATGTPIGDPGLPALVRVDDPALADAVRPLLDGAGVPIEVVASLPMLDESVTSLDLALGGKPGAPPPEPFSWDADPALLPPLYEAAAAYARRAPWQYMDDTPPIAVRLGDAGPQRNVRTLYGCVMGAAGMVQGIAFYYSLAQLERAMDAGDALLLTDELRELDVEGALPVLVEEMQRSGLPVDEIPQDVLREAMLQLSQGVAGEEQLFMQNALAVYFDTDEDSDPTYVSWIKERNLPLASRDRVPSFVRTRSRGDPRLPNDREVRALIPALQTVNGFLSRFRRDLEGPILIGERLEAQVKIPDGRMIDVYWPGDE